MAISFKGGSGGFSPTSRFGASLSRGAETTEDVTPIPFDETQAEVQRLERRYDSSAQTGADAAAAQAQMAATSASDLLEKVDRETISEEDYNSLAEIAATGYQAERPNVVFDLLEKIDRVGGVARLGVLDLFADTDKGEEIQGRDYWNMLMGRKAALERDLGEDLIGEGGRASGSAILENVFNWEVGEFETRSDSFTGEEGFFSNLFGGLPASGAWTAEAVLRGIADFGIETLLDPTTYLTFGYSAVGKKAALEAGQAAAGRYVTKALAANTVDDLTTPLTRALRSQYDDTLDKIMDEGRERILREGYDPDFAVDDMLELADEAAKKAEFEVRSKLTNEIGSALADRDFARLPDDFVKEVLADAEAPNWLAGGARVVLPKVMGGKGLSGGVQIPGSRGSLRKVTNAIYRDREWYQSIKTSEMGEALRNIKKRLSTEQAQIAAANAGELYQFNTAQRAMAKLMSETGLNEITVNLGAEAHRLARMAQDAGEDTEQVLKSMVEHIEAGDVPVGRLFADTNLDEAAKNFITASIQTMDDIYSTMKRFDPNMGEIANYVPRIMSDEGTKIMRRLAEAAPNIDTSTRGGQLLSQYLNAFRPSKGAGGTSQVGEAMFQQSREIGRSVLLPAVADTRYAFLNTDAFKDVQTGASLPLSFINDDLARAIEDTIARNGLSIKLPKDGLSVFDDDPLSLLTAYWHGMMGSLEQRVMVHEWKSVGLIKDATREVDMQRTIERAVNTWFKETDDVGRTNVEKLADYIADVERRLDDATADMAGRPIPTEKVDLGHGYTMDLPEGVAGLKRVQEAIERAKVKVEKAMAQQDAIIARRQVMINDLVSKGVNRQLAVDIAMATPDEITELTDELWEQALKAQGQQVRAAVEVLSAETGTARSQAAMRTQIMFDQAKAMRGAVKAQRLELQRQWRARMKDKLRYVDDSTPQVVLSQNDLSQMAQVIAVRADQMREGALTRILEGYDIDPVEFRRRLEELGPDMGYQEWLDRKTVTEAQALREGYASMSAAQGRYVPSDGAYQQVAPDAARFDEFFQWLEAETVRKQAGEAKVWVEDMFREAVEGGFPVERLPSASTIGRLSGESLNITLTKSLGEIMWFRETGEIPSPALLARNGGIDLDEITTYWGDALTSKQAVDPEIKAWINEQFGDLPKDKAKAVGLSLQFHYDTMMQMTGSDLLSLRKVPGDQILEEWYSVTDDFGTGMRRMLQALATGDEKLLNTPSVQRDVLAAIEMLGGDVTTFQFANGKLIKVNPMIIADWPSVAQIRKALKDADYDSVADALADGGSRLPDNVRHALEADGVPDHVSNHMNLTKLQAQLRRLEREGQKGLADMAKLDKAAELFEVRVLPGLRKVMKNEANAKTFRRTLMHIEDGKRVYTDLGKTLRQGLPGDVWDSLTESALYYEALQSTKVDRRLLVQNQNMMRGKILSPMQTSIRRALDTSNQVKRQLTVAEAEKAAQTLADVDEFVDIFLDKLLSNTLRGDGVMILPYERLFATTADKAMLSRAKKLSARIGITDGSEFKKSKTIVSTPGYRPLADAGVGGEILTGQVSRESVNLAFENLASNLQAAWTPNGMEQLKSNLTTFLNAYWKGAATVARPTFHIRNLVGAVWNNQIVDVGMREYAALGAYPTRFLHALRQYKSIDEALEVLPERLRPVFRGMLDEGIFDTTFAREFRRVSAGRGWKVTPIGKAEDLQDFIPFRAGGVAMESIEIQARAAVFYKYFDPANPIDSGALARQMVHAVHFNYQDLTQLERSIKRFVPFFVWTRRNIPLQLQVLFERPGIAMRYPHLAYSVEGQFGEETEADLFPRSQYQKGFVAESGIVLNQDTPFWSRLLFDPDIPMKQMLEINPLSAESWMNFALSSLGPQFTTALTLREQSEYPEVNAPSGFAAILKGLAAVGLYDEENVTAAGDVQIGRGARTLLETAVPFFREFEELTVGSNDPSRQQKLGQLEDENNWIERVAWTLAKGVGVQMQTPADASSQFFEGGEIVQDIARREKLDGTNLETEKTSQDIVNEILASLATEQGQD